MPETTLPATTAPPPAAEARDREPLDGAAFAAEAERLTNSALRDEWLALYHPEATAEWIIDGAHRRYDGIEEIRPAVTAMAEVWRAQRLRVRKTARCADAHTVVLTYDGGFRGRANQAGTEIWTFRDGLVIDHRLYAHLDVRPRDTAWARLRVLLTDPRAALAVLRSERRAADRPYSPGMSVTSSDLGSRR